MGRSPAEARALGLWTAFWLAVLLLTGLLWVGDPTLQWPVLVVPLLWALVALRPRRRTPDPYAEPEPLPPTRELRQLPRVPRSRGRRHG